MRILTIIFCLFLSVNALAQGKDTVKSGIRDITSVQTGSDPIYIVDGKVMPSIKYLKARDIYEMTVLSDTAFKNVYDAQAKNGAMLVTTMHGAELIYQKKLIVFSKKYKEYIDKKNGDDSKLSYVIDNTMLLNMTKKTVRELSDLAPSDIKSVDFKTDRRFKTDATVVITTTAVVPDND
jgi:hypothetical protein